MTQISPDGPSIGPDKELVAKGRLRADQLTRLLVPALLDKSDKIARGRVSRTGNGDLCEEAVQDWDVLGLFQLLFF